MTEKKTTTKAKQEPVKEIKKSQRLVSFDEYFIGKNVRSEIKAAIKINLKGDFYKEQKDWDEILKEYIN